MSYWGATYTAVANRFKLWQVDDNTTDSISDVALDTINRAQRTLWAYKQWQYLQRTATLSAVATAQSLPSDFGRVIEIYHDSDSDGRADFQYYESTSHATGGYRLLSTFTKDAGHAWTIEFYQAPSQTPILLYQMTLADFTGTGTEYSYFPADLLLTEAQIAHVTDSGVVDNELNALTARRDRLLKDFEQFTQNTNYDMRVVQNDVHGDAIETDQYSLDGSSDGLEETDYDPSFDR